MAKGVTSDHLPILISFPGFSQRLLPIPKPRLGTIDENTFQRLLNIQVQDLNLPFSKSAAKIGDRAERLVKILQAASSGL